MLFLFSDKNVLLVILYNAAGIHFVYNFIFNTI